jgi:hypothetical protein
MSDIQPNMLVPETIRQQITVGVFMSLGATDLMADRVHVKAPEYDTLTFKARILDKDHRKRVMRVRVILDPMDTYTVKVTYPKRGDPFTWVVHFEESDVYADQLATMLLSLDQVM